MSLKFRVIALALASFLAGCHASPPQADASPHPTVGPTPQLLAQRDYTEDLPQALQAEKTARQTVTFDVKESAQFQVSVSYDQLEQHPNFFSRVILELPARPSGVKVSAELGGAVNKGSKDKPLMTVPLIVKWEGRGWVRGNQWTLDANGGLVDGDETAAAPEVKNF